MKATTKKLLDTKAIRKIKEKDYTENFTKKLQKSGLFANNNHLETTEGFKPFDNFASFLGGNKQSIHISVASHT
jgi:hypothetical protein